MKLDTVYVVFKPGEGAKEGEIVNKTSVMKLDYYFEESSKEAIHAIYTDEAEATAEARKLLAIRDAKKDPLQYAFAEIRKKLDEDYANGEAEYKQGRKENEEGSIGSGDATMSLCKNLYALLNTLEKDLQQTAE